MAVEERREKAAPMPSNAPAWTFGGLSFVLEVLSVYAKVRWLVLRRGPIEAVSALRGDLQAHDAPDTDGLGELRSLLFGRAAMRILSLLPTDSRCLMQALVLTAMLARRGIATTVVIGVRPAPTFAAHAWVELNGRPLLPSDEARYRRLVEI